MKRRLVSLATVAALITALLAVAAPASATVDEITGMPCSGGNAIFAPPGITGQNGASGRADANFANPLFRTGFASIDFGFDGTAGNINPANDGGINDAIIDGPPAPLISFDENHPASKISLTGVIVFDEGIYITLFVFDNGNYTHCF